MVAVLPIMNIYLQYTAQTSLLLYLSYINQFMLHYW